MAATAAITGITVNYNSGELLKGLFASLAEQAPLTQLVVVDNASSDSDLDFLESASDARIDLIRNQTNRGFAAACNQGAALAQTPYLLFVNPDCRLETGTLARLMGILEAHPEVGMLGALLLNPDGSEQRGGRRYLPDPRRALMRVLGRDRPDLQGGTRGFDLAGTALPDAPVEVDAISGAFMLLRRQVFEEMGGWDEGYFLHCEDLDLCMRFGRAGWKILFVPDVRVYHAQGTSSRKRPVFVLWHKHRGMWRYYCKYYRQNRAWPWTLAVWGGIWLRFFGLTLLTWVRRPWSRQRTAD